MGLTLMPNGQYVNIEDGAPPEVVARIRAQNSKRVQATTSTPSAPSSGSAADETRADIARRVRERRAAQAATGGQYPLGINPRIASSASFGLSDKGEAAISALMSMFRGKSFSDEYARNKAAIEEDNNSFKETNPVQANAEDLAGMAISPVGAETGLGRVAARVAPRVAARVAASRAGLVGAKLANSSVGLGARAGINQGAIRGLVNTQDGNYTENATNEAINEGLSGALFGGIMGVGGRMIRPMLDRGAASAERVAHTKIADALDRSINPETGKAYDVSGALNEIRATDRAGGDAMLMDLSPEMRNMAGYLAARPGLPAANALENRVTTRLESAPDRFDNKIRSVMDGSTSPDAYTRRNSINAARKAQGTADYAQGGAMDAPLKWSPELDQFWREAPPATEAAIRSAYLDRLNRREMPADLHAGPDGTFTHVPDMRTLDYVKRAFDNQIGMALKSGDRSTAQGLSGELTRLKTLLSDANPEYAGILSRQRDMFQQANSVEIGANFLEKLRSRKFGNDARALLDDMTKDGVHIDDLRIGVADALLNMRKGTDNPVALMRRMMRHDDQRKVLKLVFGSNKTLNEFDKFMRREIRTTKTDNLVNPTQGSKTNVLHQQGEPDEMGAGALVGKSALQGFAFGGPAGAASRVLRAVDTLSSGLGPAAQEELARILMGKGKNLKAGIDNAKRFGIARDKLRRRQAVVAGKIGSNVTSGYAEN